MTDPKLPADNAEASGTPLSPETELDVHGQPRWTGRWANGATPRQPDFDRLRGIGWARRALVAARSRCLQRADDGFETWTAAVEGVWWALALDDVLLATVGPAYRLAREVDPDGRVLQGLRWLRHRHAHEIVVTGAGGPKRDFFDGGPTGLFYISPSNRWMPSDSIPAALDKSANLRPLYDETVAGRPLDWPLQQCIAWFDRVLDASGFVPPADDVDRTVL